jgi:hypothetical protein
MPRLKLNSHVHLPPNFSAFTTATEALDLAVAQDVRVLGTSNYYDWSVYVPFAQEARARGVFPLFGLEIICMVDELREAGVKLNDPGNPGKMYLCAKGLTQFAPMNATAQRLIDDVRADDSARIAAMIGQIGMLFAARGLVLAVTDESVKAMVRGRHGLPQQTPVYLQERHVAQAFQEALFSRVPAAERSARLSRLLGVTSTAPPEDAFAIQHEIRTNLMKAGKPGFVPETYVDFAHVYRLVLALGGIPCYTIVADGMQPISAFEGPVEQLIASVKERGIYCSELIPNRNTPEVVEQYTRALRSAGMIVLAGTEHNTLDMAPMEPTCVGGTPIPDQLKDIFWEGACVVAAHQFLVAHGQTGFVDSAGRPNAAYTGAEECISAFATLGAAVIATFCQTAAGPV